MKEFKGKTLTDIRASNDVQMLIQTIKKLQIMILRSWGSNQKFDVAFKNSRLSSSYLTL